MRFPGLGTVDCHRNGHNCDKCPQVVEFVTELCADVTIVFCGELIVTEMGYSVTIQGFRMVIVTEMPNIVTKAALERTFVTEMRYSVTNLEE